LRARRTAAHQQVTEATHTHILLAVGPLDILLKTQFTVKSRSRGEGGREMRASERTADARGGDHNMTFTLIRHGSDEAMRRRGRKARRQGDEVTRRRGDETRRRDGETTTATGMMHKRTTTRTELSKRRLGPRVPKLKLRGNDTNTLTAMASTAVSGFRNHRPQRVALFNFYVTSESD